MDYVALRIVITGLVQGVGFRPFIHRLASKHGLHGYVRNVGGSEVEVWVEGLKDSVYEFIGGLYKEKPPPAIIEEVYVEEADPSGYFSFVIEKSSSTSIRRSNIPPDFAICEHCLREILDKKDRRYRYAFNSCAWCGPRFSMIYKTPYDRANTSMRKYILCSECRREYSDINNIRRYHAQGISCPVDGPRLTLYTRDWEPVGVDDPIREAAKLVDEGYILAVKGLGGYHIASLATDDDVVLELRRRKKRTYKPFAIMGLDTDVLSRLVVIDEEAAKLLRSPQSPILLLPKREDSPVSKHVSPGLSMEGVFTAYTGLHYLLLMETHDKFLVMTSGNVTGEPMCIDEDCARSVLSGIVDYYLVHDREIVNRVDDSVLRRTVDKWVFLRRSRGYAPLWIRIGRMLSGEYVAFGSDLNNTGAVGFEDKIVLTQYIGDLDSVNAQKELLRYLDFFIRNYHIDTGSLTVVVDKHPAYHSRRLGINYALSNNIEYYEVQHHYSHVLSAAIDNELQGIIGGIAIDGAGWGDDSTIWGGELIVFSTDKPWYKRVGSIEQLPLTSDKDTHYPLRLLVGYLTARGYSLEDVFRIISSLKNNNLKPYEIAAVHKLVSAKKYTPASSTGRFLDMVSALLGICNYRSYEGEPAIKLEVAADRGLVEKVIDGLTISFSQDLPVLEYDGLIEGIIRDEHVLGVDDLARSILYSYGYMLGELAAKVFKGYGIEGVVVSGGAAVNTYIIRGLRDRLAGEDIIPLLPRRFPPNDEGVSFGQILAGDLLRKNE